MSDQSQIDALVALITGQPGPRDRSALRAQLLRDGADAALVDQALARVFDPASDPAPTAPTVSSPPTAPAALERPSVPQPADVDRIRRYLEAHRETYDREALRRQLLSDGQSREAIDLAFAQVFGLAVPATSGAVATKSGTGTIVLTFLGLTLVNLLASAVLAFVATQADQVLLAVVPGLLLIALEIGAMVYFRPRRRPVSRGIMWALIVALPFVAGGLLLGWCIAVIQTI